MFAATAAEASFAAGSAFLPLSALDAATAASGFTVLFEATAAEASFAAGSAFLPLSALDAATAASGFTVLFEATAALCTASGSDFASGTTDSDVFSVCADAVCTALAIRESSSRTDC